MAARNATAPARAGVQDIAIPCVTDGDADHDRAPCACGPCARWRRDFGTALVDGRVGPVPPVVVGQHARMMRAGAGPRECGAR